MMGLLVRQDDILHDVGRFLLSEVDDCVTNADIAKVILGIGANVFAPLHVISHRFREQRYPAEKALSDSFCKA